MIKGVDEVSSCCEAERLFEVDRPESWWISVDADWPRT